MCLLTCCDGALPGEPVSKTLDDGGGLVWGPGVNCYIININEAGSRFAAVSGSEFNSSC